MCLAKHGIIDKARVIERPERNSDI